jgi:hypothetical protein
MTSNSEMSERACSICKRIVLGAVTSDGAWTPFCGPPHARDCDHFRFKLPSKAVSKERLERQQDLIDAALADARRAVANASRTELEISERV